jgi:hypothetical protein
MHKSIAFLSSVSVAAGVLGVATPGSTQPPNVVYQFQVMTESLRTLPNAPPGFYIQCESPTVQCTVTPGNAPYLLGILTLTHKAFSSHEAQLTTETNPPTDDSGVVSFAAQQPSPIYLSVPFTNALQAYFAKYTFDLAIVGGELGGTIDIEDLAGVNGTGHGCQLSMNGIDGHWAGFWWCAFPNPQPIHAFTAIVTREHGKIASR